MVDIWKCLFFSLAFFVAAISMPLGHHYEDDYILNNTATSIIIFKNQHQNVYESSMHFQCFFVPFVENITTYNFQYAISKQNKSDENIYGQLQKGCAALTISHRHKRSAQVFAAVAVTGVIIAGGIALGTKIYEQDETLKKQRFDLTQLQIDTLKFQENATLAFYHMKEQMYISDYYATNHATAMDAVNTILTNKYNWDKYVEENIIPVIDGQAFTVVSKPIGCDNSSIKISHTVFGGSEPESIELYEFYPLGTIDNGTYVLPLLEKSYLKIGQKWATLDENQCIELKKCTMNAITFPLCNPSNIKACEVEVSNIEDNFLRFVELDNSIQIVTNIKDITLKSNKIEKSIELPPSNKLTIQLKKDDIFVVGNTSFIGKSDVPTKIIYHTNVWKSVDDADMQSLIDDVEKTEVDTLVELQHADEETQGIVAFVGGWPIFIGISTVFCVIFVAVVILVVYYVLFFARK